MTEEKNRSTVFKDYGDYMDYTLARYSDRISRLKHFQLSLQRSRDPNFELSVFLAKARNINPNNKGLSQNIRSDVNLIDRRIKKSSTTTFATGSGKSAYS